MSTLLGFSPVSVPPPSVLIVAPWDPDRIGGVNQVVTNLHRRLEALTGYRSLLLVNAYPHRKLSCSESRSAGLLYKFDLQRPISADRKIRSGLSYLRRVPFTLVRLLRLVRRENVRAINVHYPSLSTATVLLGRLFARQKFRVILTIHGLDLPPIASSDGVQRWLWRTVLAHVDAVVAVSGALACQLLAAYPTLCAKVRVIHNGVECGACEIAARASALLPGLECRRYIISIGTFEEKKGHDVLVKSFRQVAATLADVDLVLVGATGPTLPAIRRLAAEEALRDRVHIYPDVSHAETLAAIAGAALFVLPSRLEPFGIVILEAAALHTPVIASDVGGIPEIIEDGRTGLLVPPDAPAALADAIRRLLNDPQTSTSYADRLKRVVATDFTWDKAIHDYGALLPELDR